MKRFSILGRPVDGYILESMDDFIMADDMASAILLIETECKCSVVLARRYVYEWTDELYG